MLYCIYFLAIHHIKSSINVLRNERKSKEKKQNISLSILDRHLISSYKAFSFHQTDAINKLKTDGQECHPVLQARPKTEQNYPCSVWGEEEEEAELGKLRKWLTRGKTEKESGPNLEIQNLIIKVMAEVSD